MCPAHVHLDSRALLTDFSHQHFNHWSLNLHPCSTLSHSSEVYWQMPLCHFCPLPHISLRSPSLWRRCEVPPLFTPLVTAYLQRSQARASGTAPRSGLGDWGVSQETEHKYRDPNNLITSGAIRPRILEAYPREGVCVWSRAVEG